MTITLSKPDAAANGKHSPGEGSLVAHAIRFRQKRTDVNLYVTTLRLKDLLGRFQSDTCEDENPNGYQRPVTSSRLRQLSSYMRDEEGMLPTSILLCIRQPHAGLFEPNVEANGQGEYGTLTIGPKMPL